MNISVYITSYNQKVYLIEAIESVLNQTLSPFQIIIVDDCSTDGSRDVIAGYASRYSGLITPIYHVRNLGVTQSRIDALQAVKGDFVTRLDGDDRYLPSKLEKEAGLLWNTPNAEIAFSNHYFMTKDGVRTGVWAGEKIPPQGDVFCQTFARDFPRHGLFKRDLVNFKAWMKVGTYDPNLNIYEDYDMCVRLTKTLRVVYYNEPLSETRFHHSGLSSAAAKRHLDALRYIYQKNKHLLNDLSVFKRIYVERKFSRQVAELAVQVVHEAAKNDPHLRGSKMRQLKSYFQCLNYQPRYLFDYKAILRLFLTRNMYEYLAGMSRR